MNSRWCGLAIFLLLATGSARGSEMTTFQGTVTTFDNVTTEGLLLSYAKGGSSKIEPLPDTVRIGVKNAAGEVQSYDVQTATVDKIIYSGRELGECGGSRDYGTRHKTAQVVVLTNGKTYEQESCGALLMPTNAIYVSSRHPITGELSYDRIHWKKVKELRLGAHSGQVRKDDRGRTFPADYLYSPYTGHRMELVPVN